MNLTALRDSALERTNPVVFFKALAIIFTLLLLFFIYYTSRNR